MDTCGRLSAHFESVRASEVARANGKLAHLSMTDREGIDALTQAIVRKLLDKPLRRLTQNAAPNGGSGTLAEQTAQLFGLAPNAALPFRAE